MKTLVKLVLVGSAGVAVGVTKSEVIGLMFAKAAKNLKK